MPIARLDGIDLNYSVEGEGEPVVMIMGFSANGKSWMFQIPAFREKHQVITFDNRGIGNSGKPQGPYSTRMMADDTIALMDHLGIGKAHMLGISMGGMIAQEIAINYPDRVIKLVLAATYACSDDGQNGPSAELSAALSLPIKKFTSRLRGISLTSLPLKLFLGPLLNLQLALQDGPGAVGLKGQLDACTAHDAAGRLKGIQAQTLVIVGAKDRVLKPTSSKLLAQAIPHARISEFENGSHLLCMDMKDRFNREVLDFLSEK